MEKDKRRLTWNKGHLQLPIAKRRQWINRGAEGVGKRFQERRVVSSKACKEDQVLVIVGYCAIFQPV